MYFVLFSNILVFLDGDIHFVQSFYVYTPAIYVNYTLHTTYYTSYPNWNRAFIIQKIERNLYFHYKDRVTL